jgi:DNA-binding MarR family transcriptional regulator
MKYLRDFLNLTWGNLSFHTTKLEQKGYITIDKTYIGKIPYTIIQITEEGRKQFDIYRKKMSAFLELFK